MASSKYSEKRQILRDVPPFKQCMIFYENIYSIGWWSFEKIDKSGWSKITWAILSNKTFRS